MVPFPYLIQRAEIRRPLAQPDTRLSQAVGFDYMGSSEFEFGALPRSFRRIEAQADLWQCRLITEIREEDRPLRVYSAFSDDDFREYREHLLTLRAGLGHTKERTEFGQGEYRSKFTVCDFWWDITNDVMFGFDKVFMNRLPNYVAASLHYMNEEKKKREQAAG